LMREPTIPENQQHRRRREHRSDVSQTCESSHEAIGQTDAPAGLMPAEAAYQRSNR
jgi:hypothetical protein